MFRTEPKPLENSNMCGDYMGFHHFIQFELKSITGFMSHFTHFQERHIIYQYTYLKVHSSRNCGKALNGKFTFGKHATYSTVKTVVSSHILSWLSQGGAGGRSVNPISCMGGGTLSPPNTTSPPGFSDLATALIITY